MAPSKSKISKQNHSAAESDDDTPESFSRHEAELAAISGEHAEDNKKKPKTKKTRGGKQSRKTEELPIVDVDMPETLSVDVLERASEQVLAAISVKLPHLVIILARVRSRRLP